MRQNRGFIMRRSPSADGTATATGSMIISKYLKHRQVNLSVALVPYHTDFEFPQNVVQTENIVLANMAAEHPVFK